MFTRVRLKLTLLYTTLFLVIFWLISLGIYLWMDNSLQQGYITQVRQRHQQLFFPEEFNQSHATVVTIAGDVALESLERTLFIINGIALIIIPAASWFLTSKTLTPLQESNRRQRQFISDASHELRTPLSIISGEMEIALNKNRSAAYYRQVITSAREEIDKLTALIQQLLFIAKGDTHQLDRQFQSVDITDLINTILSEYQPSIRRQKLHLTFNPPDQSLTVFGHPVMLKTLFSNLINNAIKYTPTKGKINVSITSQNKTVSISVADSGIGIPQEHQAKIFNRFYRIDESRSGTQGFGLGLAMSKLIVDQHHGRIQVASQPGQGSTFTVTLPQPT